MHLNLTRSFFIRAGLIASSPLWLFPARACAWQALLWLPAGTAGTAEVTSILEGDKDLRLTAALEEIPPELESRIKQLEAEGRLELALRPAGDPPLPLLYYPQLESVQWEGKPSTSAFSGNNRYFLGLRFGFMRDAVLPKLKKIPAGLVAPSGGLVEDYFPLAKALGVNWLACGPLASTAAPAFAAEGVTAVPFINVSTSSPVEEGFLIFNESIAEDPGAIRTMLTQELKNPRSGRLTVSEALKTVAATAAAPAEISTLSTPWGAAPDKAGDYTRWASAAPQAGALSALARTRADLMLHLNSCAGDYLKAKPAFDEYFSAEKGRDLMALASPDPEVASETEIQMRSALGNAYRLMRKTPPSWVFSSLTEAGAGTADLPRLQISLNDLGFEITNTDRKPELKAAPQTLPATSDPYKIWKLERFKLEVLPEAVVFSLYPLEIDNSPQSPAGFSHIAMDIYMDINHRPRAGLTRPLNGRPLRLFPENAWEYALEVTPQAAVLHTSTDRGNEAAQVFKPAVKDGGITITVPRSLLKGNPAQWGYAALMLRAESATAFSITDYIATDIANGYIYAIRPGKK